LAGVEDEGSAAGNQLTRNRRDAVAADADIDDCGIESFCIGATGCFLDCAARVDALRTCCTQDFFQIQQKQGIIFDDQDAHSSQCAAAEVIGRVCHPLVPCKVSSMCK